MVQDTNTWVSIVGLSVTVLSFILVILLWVIEHDKAKRKHALEVKEDRRGHVQMQLDLLDRREKCMLLFRDYYSKVIQSGAVPEGEQTFGPNIKSRLTLAGLQVLFTKEFSGEVERWVIDSFTCDTHRKMKRFDENTTSFIDLHERLKGIEEMYTKEASLFMENV